MVNWSRSLILDAHHKRFEAVVVKPVQRKPNNRELHLNKFREFSRAFMLETGQEVPIFESGEKIILTLPNECSHADINVIALQ